MQPVRLFRSIGPLLLSTVLAVSCADGIRQNLHAGGLTLLKGSLEERTVKVNFSTKGHDGIMVPVFAFGPGAENFAGIHENAEVGQIVKNLLK